MCCGLALAVTKATDVAEMFIAAAQRHGTPASVLSDNGVLPATDGASAGLGTPFAAKTSASSFRVRVPTGVAVSPDPFRPVHWPQAGQAQARAGGEDRDAPGPDEESEHDENDAQEHLPLEELDDSSDDEDHSEDPQDGCHAPARTRRLMARYESPHE